MVSFVSPCVLPLVPAYISVVSGVETREVLSSESGNLKRIGLFTTLFVLGFTIVFVLLGLTSTYLGDVLVKHRVEITRISGVILVLMSLFLLGSLFVKLPGLYREARFNPSLRRLGNFAAPIAGMAFAFGWTPCIGPILSSVIIVASAQGSAGRGAALLAAYSLGLGIPFIVTGLAFARFASTFAWLKRHMSAITTVSSALLFAFGVLLILNEFTWVTIHLQNFATAVGLGKLNNIG